MLVSFVVAGVQPAAAPKGVAAKPVADGPQYTADGQMKFPANYREWVFLSSGVDMSYTADAMAMDHSIFDNVFVNPLAYQEFMKTGTWPEGTMIMLEQRGGRGEPLNQQARTDAVGGGDGDGGACEGLGADEG